MLPTRFISRFATILAGTTGVLLIPGFLLAQGHAPTIHSLNPVHQGTIPDEVNPEWLWRNEVGHGYASPAVRGQTVFAAFHRDGMEGVAAFDLESGRQRWERSWPESFEGGGYGPGPNAPLAFIGHNLLVTGVQLKIRLLDPANGTVLWQRDLAAEEGATIPGHGYAATAFIHQRTPGDSGPAGASLLYGLGGKRPGPVASLKATDGSTEWLSESLHVGYATPGSFLPMTTDGPRSRQAVFFTTRATVAIDPETGAELWRLPHPVVPTWNASLSPRQTGRDTLYTATRSDAHNGSRGIRVRHNGKRFVAEEMWFNESLSVEPMNHIEDADAATVVFATTGGGRSAPLSSIDAATGRVLSQQPRTGDASLVKTGERLLGLTERGLLIAWIADANSGRGELRELWRYDTQSNRSWSRPLLIGDRVVIRSRTRIGVVDLTTQ